MTPALLQLVDVGVRHEGADAPALRGVTLALSPGRRTGLIGPNGAGKSTLLSLLNGTREPDTGTVLLRGRPAPRDRRGLAEWRAAVGLVWQDPDDQLFAPTVLQDVAFGPLNHGATPAEAHDRAEAVLRRLGVEHLCDRPVEALSLGEKRRVAIAGIVVMRPALLVLDEPFAGLDPRGTDAVRELLDGLHADGLGLVVAAVEAESLWGWADDLVVLREGSVVAQGPALPLLADGQLFDDTPRRPALLELALRLRRSGALPSDLPLPASPQAALLEAARCAGPTLATA